MWLDLSAVRRREVGRRDGDGDGDIDSSIRPATLTSTFRFTVAPPRTTLRDGEDDPPRTTSISTIKTTSTIPTTPTRATFTLISTTILTSISVLPTTILITSSASAVPSSSTSAAKSTQSTNAVAAPIAASEAMRGATSISTPNTSTATPVIVQKASNQVNNTLIVFGVLGILSILIMAISLLLILRKYNKKRRDAEDAAILARETERKNTTPTTDARSSTARDDLNMIGIEDGGVLRAMEERSQHSPTDPFADPLTHGHGNGYETTPVYPAYPTHMNENAQNVESIRTSMTWTIMNNNQYANGGYGHEHGYGYEQGTQGRGRMGSQVSDRIRASTNRTVISNNGNTGGYGGSGRGVGGGGAGSQRESEEERRRREDHDTAWAALSGGKR